jgi:predicted RNA-binding Zn ribbon-like protein
VTRLPNNSKPFQLLGGHVALDFTNTLDERFDPAGPLELLTSYDRLLAFCREAGLMTAPDAQRLRQEIPESDARQTLERATELREALYALFTAAVHKTTPPAGALETLNQVLRQAERSRVITWDGSGFAWQVETDGTPAMAPLWQIAAAAADLLASADLGHVSECGSETCRWLFLDRSRNHSRRWCEMKTCGNRTKARRFQARLRGPRQRA